MLAKINQLEHVPTTLEALMVHLTRYGKPRLTHCGEGWRVTVPMHVSAKGTTFEVASEFGHATPMAAAVECHARIMQTLRDLAS